MKSLCIYCGSRIGDHPDYLQDAKALGRACAEAGVRIVYGAGGLGLMGAVARSCLEASGEVLGVTTAYFAEIEGTVRDVDTRITADMHERKQTMFEESDAFCALPGGVGTLEEIVEVLSWRYYGLHEKPMILLNTRGYWTEFLDMLSAIADRNFATKALRDQLIVASQPHDAIEVVTAMT